MENELENSSERRFAKVESRERMREGQEKK